MRYGRIRTTILTTVASLWTCYALADTQPTIDELNSIDAGRITIDKNIPGLEENRDLQFDLPKSETLISAPEAAKKIEFILKTVEIDGLTAFKPEEIAEYYDDKINTKISLAFAWDLAASITTKYREAGYFLSRAYVPQQNIKNGNLVIKIVEGRVGIVEVEGELRENRIIKKYIDRLRESGPSKVAKLESFLLRVNDIPGVSYRSVFSPTTKDENDQQSATLTLVPTNDKKTSGSISVDNFSSRFTGPQQVSLNYEASLIALNKTSAAISSSIEPGHLTYGEVRHSILVAPDINVGITASATETSPGYTLKKYDLKSRANYFDLNLNYQFIRQRQTNLSFKLSVDSLDVKSNMMGNTILTRDHVRAVRAGANYSLTDKWKGSTSANITISQGIDGFGASKQNAPYVSRPEAKPTFTKGLVVLSRIQDVSKDFEVLASTQGQISSGVLYFSEQIGYGGQAFGRAYDSSDISGNSGLKGLFEVRYKGYDLSDKFNLYPYSFYDVGAVWNSSVGSPKKQSGASAGAGIRFHSKWNQTGYLAVAFPLTKDIATPIYGSGKRTPRFTFQLSHSF